MDEDCGGKKHPPFVGMRPRMRWQKQAVHSRIESRDVEVVTMEDSGPRKNLLVSLRFLPDVIIEDELLSPGEAIELLDGFRVIAVGLII